MTKSSLLQKIVQTGLLGLPILLLVICSLGMIGQLWWLFDLTTHFRPHYFLAGMVMFGVLLLFKNLKNSAGKSVKYGLPITFVSLFINAMYVLPLYFPRAIPLTDETDFSIVFSNININTRDQQPLLNFIDEQNPDVVAIAEVGDEMFGKLYAVLSSEYPYSFHQRERGVFGIAVFSKLQPLDGIMVQYYGEDALPSLEFEVAVKNRPVRVITTHPFPPINAWATGNRDQQLSGIADWVGSSTTPTIIVGDLNTTPWSHIFRKLLKTGRLSNTLQGRGLSATWPSWLPQFLRIPIDHVLVTQNIEVLDRQRGPDLGSDHQPIVVKLKVKE